MDRKFWAGLLIGLGLGIVLLFGFRLAHVIRRGNLPPQARTSITDLSLIRDWMTIPYISRTYKISEEFLFDALGIPEKENRLKSLMEINDEYFSERQDFVLTRIREAIRAFRQHVPLAPLPADRSVTPTP